MTPPGDVHLADVDFTDYLGFDGDPLFEGMACFVKVPGSSTELMMEVLLRDVPEVQVTGEDKYRALAGDDCTEQEKQAVVDLCLRHRELFAEGPYQMGSTAALHHIDTGDHQPIVQKVRRHHPSQEEVINREVEELIQQGVVAPAQITWQNPAGTSGLRGTRHQ